MMPDPDLPTLYTRELCGDCQWLKGNMPENLDIQTLDPSTTDGMAAAAFHEVLETPLPVLVIDGETITSKVTIKIRLHELARAQRGRSSEQYV
jgi:hypothetical protein